MSAISLPGKEEAVPKRTGDDYRHLLPYARSTFQLGPMWAQMENFIQHYALWALGTLAAQKKRKKVGFLCAPGVAAQKISCMSGAFWH